MLRSLKIENFRCFPSFELKKLGRINLLVGKNNSGKTTVLEAIQLLYCQGNLKVFWEMMKERNEYLPSQKKTQLDVCHLFFGHQLNIDNQFLISAMDDNHAEKVTGSLLPQKKNFDVEEIKLIIKWSNQDYENKDIILPLSPDGGLNYQGFSGLRNNSRVLTQFVSSSLFNKKKLKDLFETIVLTPDENIVMQALKNIEPNIMRIAPGRSGNQGSFYVQLVRDDQRFPIGNMGDGVSRILGLFLAIVNSKDGILLVDEIDTGLHFTTMYDMWKLIYETAKRLNIQVFATTHNSDCWQSLAEIAETENELEDGIMIHRIEKGKSSSVTFSEDEMVIAAERGIEVR